MKLDTTGIEPAALRRRVEAAWGVAVASIGYMPKGEAGHHYLVSATDRQRYVARVQAAARAPDLAECFAFYAWRWVAREIADYATRILLRNRDPAEDGHAWAELAPYLPVPCDEVERAVERTTAALARIGS